MIESVLPGPYEKWFTEMSGRPSPVESRSTCDSCAMLPGAPDLPPEGAFSPLMKCCTYHPHLAPHFIGGILASGTELGRKIVRERIAARVGVTPLGLIPTPQFSEAYQEIAMQPGAFGRREEIRCPFHDQGRCSIWQHRGIVCASFHCKFERGAVSAGFWNLLVIAFNMVERAIARWLVARQGLDATACDALLHALADDAADARAWGKWRGREAEYFLEAAQLIEPLSWSELVALVKESEGANAANEVPGQPGIEMLAEALRGVVERGDAKEIPARVVRGEGILYRLGKPGEIRLQQPMAFLDLIDVPEALAQRIAKLTEATKLSELGIDEALLRRLLDWRVLLAAAP